MEMTSVGTESLVNFTDDTTAANTPMVTTLSDMYRQHCVPTTAILYRAEHNNNVTVQVIPTGTKQTVFASSDQTTVQCQPQHIRGAGGCTHNYACLQGWGGGGEGKRHFPVWGPSHDDALVPCAVYNPMSRQNKQVFS